MAGEGGRMKGVPRRDAEERPAGGRRGTFFFIYINEPKKALGRGREGIAKGREVRERVSHLE